MTQTVSSVMLPRAERLLMFSFVVVFLFQSRMVCPDDTYIWRMSSNKFVAYRIIAFSLRQMAMKRRGAKLQMAKSKKNNSKPKLNLTVRRRATEQTGANGLFRDRSLSNLIEVMADRTLEATAGAASPRQPTDHALMLSVTFYGVENTGPKVLGRTPVGW